MGLSVKKSHWVDIVVDVEVFGDGLGGELVMDGEEGGADFVDGGSVLEFDYYLSDV